MKKIVLSLGGSIIVPAQIDTDFLKKFKGLITGNVSDFKFCIITGGGKTCRDYQNAARLLAKIPDLDADIIGIASTKLNAELVRAIFGKLAFERVIQDPKEKVATDKILIGCGHLPGSSSDLDAVERAITSGADTVINLSNIEYVYDKDPKRFKDAKPLKDLSWKDFTTLVGKKWVPGMNTPFDPVAARLAQKHGIKVVLMKGTDLGNLKNYLHGKPFIGTSIL